MTITEALQELDLPIKSDLSIKDVKANFRKKMRACHPDINPEIDDHVAAKLNDAYKIVITSVENGELADVLTKQAILEKYKQHKCDKPTVVLTVEQLCAIYSGETLTVKSLSGTEFKLDKNNRGLFNLIITFKVKIETDNLEDTKTAEFNFCHQVRDTYSTEFNINVDSLTDDYKAKLSCAGTKMNLNMPNGVKRINLKMRFDYNIILDIVFTKKVVNTE